MATRIYKTPFAATGDKETLATADQPDGKVSLQSGWTPDYELPNDNANYRPVGRGEMNGVINEITQGLGEVQLNGFAKWQAIVGGWPLGAYVVHNGVLYWSAIDNNADEPGASANWDSGGGFVPAGSIFYVAQSAVPNGFLKANGAAVPRTVYARLFAAIGTMFGSGDGSTTFNLPDLRGEFLRGADDGRGVDPGRTHGSSQASANLAHTHSVSDPGHSHGVYDPGHVHVSAVGSFLVSSGGSWSFNDFGAGGASNNTAAAGTGVSIAGSSSRVWINQAGGTESRPRNIALLACIKY
ncbi:phage tail protein [Achromobacter denitrificans]|uniref:Phage tail protein n=1 Tax=Achromobacter denitrificans TaxID=32002 RepID=A0ABZ3G6K4_ACHDE